MKKCDCYNQHDQEIRDVLNDLKAASLHMKEKSKVLNRLIDAHEKVVQDYEAPNPLVGILAGACIIAAIVGIAAIVIKIVR